MTDAQPVGRGLYNGNISSMLVNIPKLGDAQLYGYSYDQLNRLTAMNSYTGLNTGNNSFVPSGTTHYRERVSYDGNGNILSYLRNGEGTNTSMDNLSYAYNLSGGWLQNNKLRHVTDAVTTTPTGYGDLKNGQASDNYGYDAIGNLIKDESEGIASGGIEWNVYGKISQITKTNSGVTTVIKYTYDATGNRIGKWVQIGAGTPKQTAYVRDASGNVMAIYEKGNSEVNGGLLSQIEVPLYGSSRLGVWRPDREVETTGWELFDTDPMTGTGGGIAGGWERGRVQFELSNHLGNVLVTISDVRMPVLMPEGIELCDDPVHPACYRPIDYYLPQVLTANDYYPFGMIMPGRRYSEDEYRYGFNGKEKDNDINSLTAYDYGFRIYNPAIGRFLSVDPLMQSYPWYTPYQFAGNNPIWAIDVDGLEEDKVVENAGPSNPNDEFFKKDGVVENKTLQGVVAKTKKAPWYKRLWNFTKKEVFPRVVGGLKTVAGATMVFGGALLSEVGIGVPIAIYGADLAQSGARQVWDGQSHETFTNQAMTAMGASKETANHLENVMGTWGGSEVSTLLSSPKSARGKNDKESEIETNIVMLGESDNLQATQVFNTVKGGALPGSSGAYLGGSRLSSSQMQALTDLHGVEFAQIYTAGSGRNGGGGFYTLYSGGKNYVEVPFGSNSFLINHTHPGGDKIPK